MYINEAWLAGFIEGDGCFSTQTSNYKYKHPKIEIHQKNTEPLVAIADAFGWRYYPNGRLARVQTTGTRAVRDFNKIAPYLSDKRMAQAAKRDLIYNGERLNHDLSWFAGYYEAEGCIHTKTNGQFRSDGTQKLFVALTVSQYYSEQTSCYCVEAVGSGRVGGPYMARGERRAYSFNLSGQEAIETIEKIQHMLSKEKIAQLENVRKLIE